MKPSPPLIRELRSLFGFLRWLMIIWLVVLPVTFFGNWHHSKQGTTNFGPVEFNPAIPASRVDSPLTVKPADGLWLQSLTGSLNVADREDGARLIAATRVPVFVNR